MNARDRKDGFYRRYGKRFLDIVLTLPALIVLAPLMAVLAIVVGVSLGAPVLFRQRRPGWRARPFTLVKFRTMVEARDGENPCSSDAERLTPFGGILRRLSLDELPELLNVLKGDMSLVGPRPLLKQYLDRYTPEQARRHEVRPGITGWAQVNGRNALTWKERFRLDIWYVDHVSLELDIRIIARTAGKVLKREGIHHPEEATMKEFMGSGEGE
jgi:sugar transferase EpsL